MDLLLGAQAQGQIANYRRGGQGGGHRLGPIEAYVYADELMSYQVATFSEGHSGAGSLSN